MSDIDELESSVWDDWPDGEEKDRALMGSFQNWTDQDLDYLMRRGYIDRVVTMSAQGLRKIRIWNGEWPGQFKDDEEPWESRVEDAEAVGRLP